MVNTVKKMTGLSSGLLASFIGGIPQVFAQGTGAFFQGATPSSISAVSQSNLGTAVQTIINYALGFLGLVAVAFIIYGGVLLVTSGGNDEAMGKAKKILMYAVIGIVIIMLSYTIVTFVTSALG